MQYAEIAKAAIAVLIVFVVPILLGTLVFRRVKFARPTAAAWSMAANSAALVAISLILRTSGIGLFRESFLALWLAWIGAMLFILCRSGAGILACQNKDDAGRNACTTEFCYLTRRWGPGLAVGLLAVVVGIAVFAPEHFSQCFNGDGTEASDLAAGLKDHLLPYWEIEAIGRFGTYVVNPTWINSQWTLALQLVIGENETAARLPAWVWWFGIFAISLRMTSDGGRHGVLMAVPLALSMLLVCTWYTFYTGYYPYMADLGAPAVPDAMFTMQLLLALDCLLRGDRAGWVVSMLLSSIILYAGPVMFVLIVAAALVFKPLPREKMLRSAAVALAGMVVVGCLYLASGWYHDSISGWWATWEIEYINDYLDPTPLWQTSPRFFAYFLLGCGTIPAVALLAAFRARQDEAAVLAWEKTVAVVAIVYLLIVLSSGYKNLHYLGPIVPLPLILWLRRYRPSIGVPLATVGLLVSIAICWPAQRTVFTLNRDLGRVTTFQTDDYAQAAGWGEIAGELYDESVLGWQVSQHTWAQYAQLEAEPGNPRPFLITDGAAPNADYTLLYESPEGIRFFSRDTAVAKKFAEMRPPSGSARCPKIFQSIAIDARPRRPSDSS